MKTFTVKHCLYSNPEKNRQPDQIQAKSPDEIFETFTAERLELFLAIAAHRPESTDQLFEMLPRGRRDPLGLHADLMALMALKLIGFEHTTNRGNEGIFKPIAKYDRIVFEFVPEPSMEAK